MEYVRDGMDDSAMRPAFLLPPIGTPLAAQKTMSAQNYRPPSNVTQSAVQSSDTINLQYDLDVFSFDFVKEMRLNSSRYNNAWNYVKNKVASLSTVVTKHKVTQEYNELSRNYPFQSEKAHILDSNDTPIFTSQVHYSNEYVAFTVINLNEKKTEAILEISKASGSVTGNIPINAVIPVAVDTKEQADNLNTTLFIAWLGVAFIKAKYSSKQGQKTIPTKGGNKLQSETNCITHDLKCSGMSFVGITANGDWKLWFPCVGGFTANVSDCCKKHDIAMWCSKNEFDRIAADATVAQCVTAKVIDDGASQMSDFCKLIGALALMVAFFSVSIIFQVGFLVGGFFYASYLLNYDGRNSNSCLCGGKEPTVQCDDRCRDLCLEMQKNQDCYPCGWKCIYNDDFFPIRVEYVSAPKGKVCCPTGTTECAGSKEKALLSCPSKCSHCYTECGIDPRGIKGYSRYVVNPGKIFGLPCCKGTPTTSIKEPCPPIPNPFETTGGL